MQSALAVDVRPFIFTKESSDSVAQQTAWESLLKYKLWGTRGIEFTGEGKLNIKETSGFTGTATGSIWLANDHKLGGPVLSGKNLNFKLLANTQLLGGPARVLGNISLPAWASQSMKQPSSQFDGPYCVKGTLTGTAGQYDPTETTFRGLVNGGVYDGDNYANCPEEVPQIDVNLAVPDVDFTNVTWEQGVNISPSTSPIAYIHVPPDSVYTNNYGTYDKYIDILKVEAVSTFKLYVLMPPGGRLTRIFVRDGFKIDNSAHQPKIQVVYVPDGQKFDRTKNEWDLSNTNEFTYTSAYRGNLLFYTKKDVDWGSTDRPEYQGTFMTSGKMTIGNSFSVSGQLIADSIRVRTPYTGNFKYIPFDPPILDLDPEVLASNIFPESDLDSMVPVRLSETSLNEVSFNYCFDVKSSSATMEGYASKEDFNVTKLSKFPICGKDTGLVKIAAGERYPSDKYKVYVNVANDTLQEPEEILIFRVFNLGGAVLPGNKLEGFFKLRIVDRYFPPIAKNIALSVLEDNSLNFVADSFKAIQTSITPVPQEGILITNTPARGVLTYKGDTLKVTGKNYVNIPMDSIKDLKFVPNVNEYDTTKYVTIKYIAKDVHSLVSNVATVSIKVFPVNDAPVVSNAEFTIYENNSDGELLTGAIKVSDVDDSKFTYEFDKSSKSFATVTKLFEIDANTGKISVKKGVTLDYETMSVPYKINVIVSDKSASTGKASDILSAVSAVTISVLDKNESPILASQSFTITENKAVDFVVGFVTFDDLDIAKDFRNDLFTAIGGDTALFNISEKGKITTKKVFNYETDLLNYTLQVKLCDAVDKKLCVTKPMNIDLLDTNDNPVIITEKVKVKENSAGKTVVDTVKATDEDPCDTVFTYKMAEISKYFEISKSGVITVKDGAKIDYETIKSTLINVEVSDEHGGKSNKAIFVEILDVPASTIKITKAENTDTTYKNPETIYTNLNDIKLYCVVDGAPENLCADTTLTEGKNVIVKSVNDSLMDGAAYDTVIVYVSTATPIVTVSASPEAKKDANIYTIVEKTDKKDTNIYVNKTKNDIYITVQDPVNKKDTSFVVKLDLDTVKVPEKSYSELLNVAKESVALNENPSSGVTRTPVNGSETKITYTEKVAGTQVEVSYSVDKNGDVMKLAVVNAKGKVDSIEVITVTYKTTINNANGEPQTVSISYKADAITGAMLYNDETGNLTTEATKSDSKSDKNSKDLQNVQASAFNVTYDSKDASGNVISVSYNVNEKGDIVKNAHGDIGYSVAYNYVNKYGNSATASVFIVLDKIAPKVEIISPAKGTIVRSNFVNVVWSIDGIEQDTLTVQGLEKGSNVIVRFYRDKAGNETSDTIFVVMKDSKDVEISIEQPVTKVDKELVQQYYAENPPKEGETFAVSIKNPTTGKEIETLIGGDFKTTKGSEREPYPGLETKNNAMHLGPTLSLDIKLPIVNGIGGLATMDDLLSNDGMVALEGVDADNSEKVSVETYVQEYCDAGVKIAGDLSRINLYKSKLDITVWVYTSLGNFVDKYSFTQELNNPDYTNEAGLLQMFFEMKPDKDGEIRAKNGKLIATGAYVYKVDASMRSELRCTLPPVADKSGKKKGNVIKSSDELLKPFGYKRPADK